MLRLLRHTLVYYWRLNLAVAFGVTAGTAVLTGALVVGDSVRGSLRSLALDRLGRIDQALVAGRLFRGELAAELSAEPQFAATFEPAVPAILLRGTLVQPDAQRAARAGDVTVLAADPRPWELESHTKVAPPGANEVVLNEPLARELRARVGDEVLLRVPIASDIPADSPLGRKTETVQSRRLRVSAIVPAEGLGRFGLRPSQQLPNNAFVALSTLQRILEQPGKVNALFVAEKSFDETSTVDPTDLVRPALADYGLTLAETPGGYFSLSSDRMLLEPEVVSAARDGWKAHGPQPVLTYLANSIESGEKSIPYSTVAGLDFVSEPPFGPFNTPEGQVIGPLADDEIVLSQWAAQDLGVVPGATIRLRYFAPESTHGEAREHEPPAEFRLKAIAAMSGPAVDRSITPELKGVTDQNSIDNWDPPFPFDSKRVRDQDEAYWDQYRATPKAFVSLAAARKLWGSRFGDTTSIRVPAGQGVSAESLVASLKLAPRDLGLQFQPVKRQALLAAAGTTPFNALFLGFSMFLIAAAVMLVALLFRLGVEWRAAEMGLLMAVGLRERSVRRLLLAEGLAVSVLGGLAGAALGIGYAWLMLVGLRTWWLAAIRTPFLKLYVTPASLAIGWTAGVLVSLGAIYLTARRMARLPARSLLAGQTVSTASWQPRPVGRWMVAAVVLLFAALALGLAASRLGAEVQAGAFFGAGVLTLSALLAALWAQLRAGRLGQIRAGAGAPLLMLALRNAGRNPLRSTLTIGLVAAATFLIVAISAFRLDPSAAGSGHFALVAQSDQPIYGDLNTPEGRERLGFDAEAEPALAGARIVPFRVRAGDDASCLNLYQPREPRMLGVPGDLAELTDREPQHAFAWAATAAATDQERRNPWRLLDRELPAAEGVPVVPAILDMATAMYSLHLWNGVGETFDLTDERGDPLRLQVVGLLQNRIFQGDVLLAERNLLRHFPDVSGQRFFLIDAPADTLAAASGALEATLGDYGLDAQPSADRLAGFLAVQNTYLQTFQSLGALGLLLGTLGLATVQLRSVFERRGELALLQATGFRRSRLAAMVLLENALLLVFGLGAGVLAALVAVAPHLLAGGAAVPWLWLLGTLGLVLAAGLAAGGLAVRATLRAPLVPALRGE
jgi:ABC-type lipoprotein release transport system permease subunit